jgi:hypothetical protein
MIYADHLVLSGQWNLEMSHDQACPSDRDIRNRSEYRESDGRFQKYVMSVGDGCNSFLMAEFSIIISGS